MLVKGKSLKKRRVKLCILITLIVIFISSFIILLNLQNQSPDFNEDKIAINYRTPQSASVFMAEGQDGSEENPYIISNAEDMNALSQAVSAGNTFAGKIIVVASGISEINLGDFQPIGTNTRVFSGIFDGSGVNFRLSIDKLETDYVGLFGVVERGTIENLSVSGTITGKNRVGGIVGQQNVGSIIRNVYNTATVIGNERVGGIVGYINQGTVTNTYNRGEIIGNASVGGVVGYTYIYRYNRSTTPITVVVTNNYSSGLVTANSRVGGVIGYLDPLRYSTSSTYSAVTTRSNLYYDITVIANYAQKRAIKPSSLVSTEGLDSEMFFTIMNTKFSTQVWQYDSITSNYGFYPQLRYFSEHSNNQIKSRSLEANTVDIVNGIGTESRPFLIRTVSDIDILKHRINAGNTFEGFYFVISNTYEETDLGNFSPIGINGKPFYGSFDGNHTQFTLAIDTAGDYQGLFGRFGRGTIKNLSVVGSIKAGSYVGGIVGYQESGIIENVYNLATITAASNVGGLVGLQANGTIRVSYNDGDIDASGNNIGGIVGRLNQGTVTNTYNRGEIVGNRYVGGLVGYTYRFRYVTSNTPITINITNSYSAGLVSANQNVGGTIGFNDTTRYSSSSTYAAQTVQSNLYYDVSILSTYDQPKDLKPSTVVTGSQFTTDKLIYTSDSQLGFTAGTWYYRAKEGTTAYYPQLIVFSTSSVTHISTDSIHSTSYDVGDGLGTKEFPFLIRTKFDMDELSRKVAEGNTYIGYHFKVDDGIDHIDLEAFIPIGNASVAFRGNFDGNGTNFNIHTTNDQVDYQGLFGVVDTGIIENLSVSGTITGKNRVGGIVGQQNVGSIIRNVYNTATVIGNERVGGIVGYINQGTVTNTYNRGEIIGNASVGGVVGYTYIYRYNRSTTPITVVVTNNYSSGLVTANSRVGGVIGYLDPLRYSTSSTYSAVTTRSNLYYDITVIANYAQKRAIKPSSLVSTEGLDSGQMFNIMTTKLTYSGWFFRPSSDGLAYYPQLTVFSDNENEDIKIASTASVIVDISDGLGTEDYPFILYNKQDLEDMKAKINAGNTFEGFYFVISNTYEETDLGNFSPIGIDGKPFYGSFDGNHTQFTLAIDTAGDYQGLFGRFGRGTIKNLSVVGSIKAGSYVGGIVGYQESGIIENVYNLATITAASNVGGLVGLQANGTIRVSYNDGDIDASGNNIGGIVGRLNQGTVTNTYNRGEIVGNRYVGGLVGYTYRFRYVTSSTPITINITNSYSAGLVSANQNVGGTIGFNDTTRYSSSSTYAAQTVQSNLYYDVSILSTYDQPKDLKPSTTIGGQGLDKVSMFENGMESRGFTQDFWAFKSIEGNFAYYPQLKVFSTSVNNNVQNDSIESVKTNPFMGDGTKENPYLIRNAYDMEILSKAINVEYDALNIYYMVAAGVSEIDLTNVDFIGIGNQNTPFRGHFDGAYVNFIIELDTTKNYQGLFGHISSGASVRNLSVVGSITANNNVGAIVGYNNGTITNVYSKVNIRGNNNVGGLVGYNNGTIMNAYATGDTIANQGSVGGLIGFNNGAIENGFAGGKVHGLFNVGGLIGYSSNNNFEHIFYNQTLIYYDDIIDGLIKPTHGVSTHPSASLGLEKEQMTGLDIFGTDEGMLSFDSDTWSASDTSGLYDYYPQLKVFSEHTNAIIRNNSNIYSRIIRFTYGSGSQSNPYLIRNEDDMKALSDITTSDHLAGIYFKVEDGVKTLDLTIDDLGFNRIGPNNTRPFRGGFDGNGVTIIINTDVSTSDYVGLFGYLGDRKSVV